MKSIFDFKKIYILNIIIIEYNYFKDYIKYNYLK